MQIIITLLAYTCQLLALATIPLYVYLGYRLGESMLRWGFMGFGALLFLPLICMPVLYIGKPAFLLMFWTLIQCISPILALGIAAYIAYKRGLFNKAIA